MDNSINEVSRICTSAVITGDYHSKNDLRVDGALIGNVSTTGRVVVGEGAYINGDIICNGLDVWGEVHGNMYVKDVLSLKASAVVKGDMVFDRFQVEIGASFSGSCTRIEPADFDAKLAAQEIADPRKASSSQIIE